MAHEDGAIHIAPCALGHALHPMAYTALPTLTNPLTASGLMGGIDRSMEPGVPAGGGVAFGAGAWAGVAGDEDVGGGKY